MNTGAEAVGEAVGNGVPLYRTLSGGKLHIPPCPHVRGVELFDVIDAERLASEVCSWCRAEIIGEGRTYFDTIDEALEFFDAPRADRAELGSLLRQVEFDQIYVPFSRAYVAVAYDGKGAAWAGKTYVHFYDRPPVLLASYTTGDGDTAGGQTGRDGPWGDTCPIHNVLRSLNGECELCS